MRVALLASLWLGLVAQAAWAQSGKLAGRITDAQGMPLPGATVFVEGTTLGAAADIEGDYVVLRIPPGTYRVRFSMVGYQVKVVEGVIIASNQTTTLNVSLEEAVLTGQEVVVVADRPVVDVTLTSTMATVSRQEIEQLPVQRLEDLVNLQAGVVDGVTVNNPFNNQSMLTLDRSVLQEVQVIQGTFDAE